MGIEMRARAAKVEQKQPGWAGTASWVRRENVKLRSKLNVNVNVTPVDGPEVVVEPLLGVASGRARICTSGSIVYLLRCESLRIDCFLPSGRPGSVWEIRLSLSPVDRGP